MLLGLTRHRHYVHTFGTEFAILVSRLLVLKVAGSYWDTVGFGAFVIARRSTGLLALPVLCGMGLAVTRYVALARGGASLRAANEYTYLRACTIVASVTLLSFAVLALATSAPLADALFGSRGLTSLVWAIVLAVSGLTAHALAYGMLRGQLAMARANVLQGINLAIVPLSVFLVPNLSVAQVVARVGGLWSIIGGAALFMLMSVGRNESHATEPIGPVIREVLSYGAPRVPGEFAYGALFSLPAIAAAHLYGLEQAGFVGLGVSLLAMVGALFAPLGLILLPEFSTQAAKNDIGRVKRTALRLTAGCVAIGVLVVVIVLAVLGPATERLMGPGFVPAVPVLRVIAFASVPFVAYVVLRNVLDAMRTAPLNAKNMIIALIACGIGIAAGDSIVGLAWAFAGAVSLLGVLTVLDAWRVIHKDLHHDV